MSTPATRTPTPNTTRSFGDDYTLFDGFPKPTKQEAQTQVPIRLGFPREYHDAVYLQKIFHTVLPKQHLMFTLFELRNGGKFVNVSLETVADIAATGVDFISIGAITHSAKASDFSLTVIE